MANTRPLISALILLLGILLGSCGTDKEFRINGTIDGMGTGNIKVVFYSGDAVQSMSATAIDGKFMMTGRVEDPTIVRLYNNTGALVGRMAIEPGETVDVNFNLKEPWVMKAEGNDDSEYLASFLKDNQALLSANDCKGLNEAIAQYVEKHPDRGVSALLLTDFYTPGDNLTRYGELLGMLGKNARMMGSTSAVETMVMERTLEPDSLFVTDLRLFGRGDSLRTIPIASKGHTILMITTDESRWADSIQAAVSRWEGKYRRSGGVRILDISVDKDTAVWHRSLKDSKSGNNPAVERYWNISPRHITGLERVAVGRLPWFVEADSTGRVIYSGSLLKH